MSPCLPRICVLGGSQTFFKGPSNSAGRRPTAHFSKFIHTPYLKPKHTSLNKKKLELRTLDQGKTKRRRGGGHKPKIIAEKQLTTMVTSITKAIEKS